MRRSAYAHLAVQAICLTVLIRRAQPVKQYLSAPVAEVHFSLPRRAEQALPVRFIQDGDDTAAPTDALVSRDLFDVHTLSGNYIVAGHVRRRGFF